MQIFLGYKLVNSSSQNIYNYHCTLLNGLQQTWIPDSVQDTAFLHPLSQITTGEDKKIIHHNVKRYQYIQYH